MCLRKRLLSITTALMMVLSLAPAVAFADDDAASAAETNAVTEEVAEEVTEEAAEEMTEEMADYLVNKAVLSSLTPIASAMVAASLPKLKAAIFSTVAELTKAPST